MTRNDKPLSYYQDLAIEILIQLRGSVTQMELSKALGYSYNQVGKWENKVTNLSWDDFTRICDVLSIPWKEGFNSCFCLYSGMNIEKNSAFDILAIHLGHFNVDTLSKKLNISKSSISRILNEKIKIDFCEILKLADYRPYVLLNWLVKFTKISEILLLKGQIDLELNFVKGLCYLPWTPIVNACFYLSEYHELPTHSNDWISKKTGLNVLQVEQAIQKLIEYKVIEYQNKHFYSFAKDFTLLRSPEIRKTTAFLTQSFARSYSEKKPSSSDINNPSLTSTRIQPMSSRAARKIAEAVVEFHQKVTNIIDNDSDKPDHVRAILLQSTDLSLCTPVSISENKIANIEKSSINMEL